MARCDMHSNERTTAASDWLKSKTKCIISDTVVFYDNEPKTVSGFGFVLVFARVGTTLAVIVQEMLTLSYNTVGLV